MAAPQHVLHAVYQWVQLLHVDCNATSPIIDTMHKTTLSEASVGTHDASHVVKSKTGLTSVLSLMVANLRRPPPRCHKIHDVETGGIGPNTSGTLQLKGEVTPQFTITTVRTSCFGGNSVCNFGFVQKCSPKDFNICTFFGGVCTLTPAVQYRGSKRVWGRGLVCLRNTSKKIRHTVVWLSLIAGCLLKCCRFLLVLAAVVGRLALLAVAVDAVDGLLLLELAAVEDAVAGYCWLFQFFGQVEWVGFFLRGLAPLYLPEEPVAGYLFGCRWRLPLLHIVEIVAACCCWLLVGVVFSMCEQSNVQRHWGLFCFRELPPCHVRVAA
eukprot:6338695-Amphidinium_carterae.1